MANVCIVCKKEVSPKDAVPIKEDKIIQWIRTIKGWFRMAQNNKLFVCKGDLEEHQKRRKQFERDVVVFGLISVAIVILLVGLPLLGGRLSFGLFLISLVMGTLVFVLGALFKYAPAIQKSKGE